MLLTNIPHVSHAARAAGAIWVNVEGTIAASMAGTTAARRILEAMTDHQFRTWADRVITVIALYYLGQGAWLLLV